MGKCRALQASEPSDGANTRVGRRGIPEGQSKMEWSELVEEEPRDSKNMDSK